MHITIILKWTSHCETESQDVVEQFVMAARNSTQSIYFIDGCELVCRTRDALD